MKALKFAIATLPLSHAQPARKEELPWTTEPPRYTVEVPSDSGNVKTLSLYPADGIVGINIGTMLGRYLNPPGEGAKKWTLVELYDHSCPHCWYAVPVVTQVARAYTGSSDLHITSLDCHMEDNMQACFLLEELAAVQDFPSFLLCPPYEEFSYEDLADRLTPHAFALYSKLPKGSKAREKFVELHRCSRRFVERTARGPEDPFLSSISIASWISQQTKIQATHPEELMKGANFLGGATVSATAPPGRPGWLRDEKAGRPGVARFVPAQRWYDALHGFLILAYQGYQSIRHQQLLLVTRYLSKVYPMQASALDKLALKLEATGARTDPSEVREVISVWAKQVGFGDLAKADANVDNTLLDLPDHAMFTCRDSITCAMWTLLHVTLTTVAVRGFTGRYLLSDANGHAGEVVDMGPTADVIRNAQGFVRVMVDGFLNCGPCKRNFLADYDRCTYGRCSVQDYRSLPLWLWRVHNAINLHVAKEQGAGVDRRWPMYEDCPACWKEDLVINGSRVLQTERRPTESRYSSEELDAPFDTQKVFWHLVRTYVGIHQVVFALGDFQGSERQEIEQVLTAEGVLSPDSSSDNNPPPPASVEVKDPIPRLVQPPSPHHASTSQLLLGLLVLSVGVASIVFYCSGDSALLDDIGGRSGRMPMIRSPQANYAQAQDDELELVPDSAQNVQTLHHHDDISAE